MCEARTSVGLLTSSSRVTGYSVKLFRQSFFRLRMASVTSSFTFRMAVNSWATPSIWIEVTAAPSSEDSRTRRSVLPSVVPKPGSSGSISKRPYFSSADSPSSTLWTWGVTGAWMSIAKTKTLPPALAAVELHDQVLFDALLHLRPFREHEHLGRPLLVVEGQPRRHRAQVRGLERHLDGA